ncbi:MAG: methyltransferase domain-containing protein [Candidatus Pacearchaeota archaeon]|nr:methyltransferase domain-containing protein [Candidatus Pacearchaeota archaeon]
MKYLFILGRNTELSLAEIFSYFEKTQNKILNHKLNQNALLLDLEKPIKNIIDDFGGVISIGEVICQGNEKELLECINKKELYFGEKNKLNYCIWNYSEFYEELSNYIKQRFKKEKLKATEKTLAGKIESQQGEDFQKLTSKLINQEFFIFGKNKLYFGEIKQKCNYKKLEERDMSRPIRRESLSISPRLAKIMINLSQVRKDEKLLDPFCGVGVILQEALLQEIEVIGIDKDKKAIDGAKENLEYLNFPHQKYKLINWDSSTAKVNEVNVLVTEPDFGETLKKIPTKQKAQQMLTNYENLMIKILNNLKKFISKRIIFTAPFIRIGKKRLGCNIQNILDQTNLKLAKINNLKTPFQEFRKNQIVGREIFILE